MPDIDDTVKGFFEEVKGYIQPITEGIQSFSQNPGQLDALEEAHRLVHTIKGAASLLDFMGLSHVAGEMELDFTLGLARVHGADPCDPARSRRSNRMAPGLGERRYRRVEVDRSPGW